jgi:hypothetical protein
MVSLPRLCKRRRPSNRRPRPLSWGRPMARRKPDGAGFQTKRIKAKLNAPPDGPWMPIGREMLRSGAMRALSLHARCALDRIMVEHMDHAGQENGRLKVTWQDLEKFGVHRSFIKRALSELAAAAVKFFLRCIWVYRNPVHTGVPETRYIRVYQEPVHTGVPPYIFLTSPCRTNTCTSPQTKGRKCAWRKIFGRDRPMVRSTASPCSASRAMADLFDENGRCENQNRARWVKTGQHPQLTP